MTPRPSPVAGGVSHVWAPITKMETLDDGSVRITGVVSDESIDSQGERILYEASKSGFQDWAERNLREMHDEKVVGGVDEIFFDDDARTVSVVATVDADGAPETVAKIKKGRLKGFSVGGSVPAGHRRLRRDEESGRPYVECDRLDIDELSVVDSPANRSCYFTLMKRDQVAGDLIPATMDLQDVGEDGSEGAAGEAAREGASTPEGPGSDDQKQAAKGTAHTVAKAAGENRTMTEEDRARLAEALKAAVGSLSAALEMVSMPAAEDPEAAKMSDGDEPAAKACDEPAAKMDDEKKDGAESVAKSAEEPKADPVTKGEKAAQPKPEPMALAPELAEALVKFASMGSTLEQINSRLNALESQPQPPKAAAHENTETGGGPGTVAKSLDPWSQMLAKAEESVGERPDLDKAGRSQLVAFQLLRAGAHARSGR